MVIVVVNWRSGAVVIVGKLTGRDCICLLLLLLLFFGDHFDMIVRLVFLLFVLCA